MDNQNNTTQNSQQVKPPLPAEAQAKAGPFLSKTAIVLIIVILVFFTIIYIGIYSALNKRVEQITQPQTITPTPAISPAPNGDMANWKTYKNEKYGSTFSFKYPSSYKILKEGEEKDEEGTELFQIIFLASGSTRFGAEIFNIGLYNKKIPENKNLSDLIVALEKSKPNWICDTSPTMSDKFPVLDCSQEIEPSKPDPDEDYPHELYFISPQRFLFQIAYFRRNEKLINQILSTFKFLDGTNSGNDGCVIGGCSGELCVESSEAQDAVSICIYRAEYECYKSAKCERQNNGKCGWTQTDELRTCLEGKKNSNK